MKAPAYGLAHITRRACAISATVSPRPSWPAQMGSWLQRSAVQVTQQPCRDVGSFGILVVGFALAETASRPPVAAEVERPGNGRLRPLPANVGEPRISQRSAVVEKTDPFHP